MLEWDSPIIGFGGSLYSFIERLQQMNVFSIKNRRVVCVDNPPGEGGGSDEAEKDDVQAEGAGEPDAGLDVILDAIAAIAEKVEALSERMDAFVDAGATVRETDDADENVEDDGDVDEDDLETAIEDMDFGLDETEEQD